ncbi:MAG: DUF3307 domain-containing protein [Gammaproteobacteria bacterium]|nr:DUF3307 domain-containing protein [Gammaproteobacteria bacterium]
MGLLSIALLIPLFIKHFIADFKLQPPYMYKNKGNLFHPGGWIHAGIHATMSFLIILSFSIFVQISVWTILAVCVAELFVHYSMDYIKVNVCKKNGYTPTTHEEWFTWLGIDQTVHSLTYLAMVAILLV